MKLTIKNLSTMILSAIIVSFGAHADVSLHNNAHTLSNAQTIYDTWKANQTTENDPFYRVLNGYKDDKNSAIEELFNNTIAENKSSYTYSSLDAVVANIGYRKAIQFYELSEAYYAAKSDDSEFDHELYLSQVETYLQERATTSSLQYEQRVSTLGTLAAQTSSGILNINAEIDTNQSDATANLVSILKNDFSAKRSSVFEAFADNIELARTTLELSTETVTLAANFSGECPACEFTTDPVLEDPVAPVDPEPDPSGDLPTMPQYKCDYFIQEEMFDTATYYNCL